MKPEEVGPFVAGLRRMVTEFNELPMPVIAALDGAAVGGGLEMALGCDMRTAGEFKNLWGLMTPYGTKPLPEPMLTNDQWGVVAFTW